jgi:hypothetical protein
MMRGTISLKNRYLCCFPPATLAMVRSKDIQDMACCYGNENTVTVVNPPRRPLPAYFITPIFLLTFRVNALQEFSPPKF